MSTFIGKVLNQDNAPNADQDPHRNTVGFVHASVGGVELHMERYASIPPLQARLFAKMLEAAADEHERMRGLHAEIPLPLPLPTDAGAHAVSINCPCHHQSPCPRMGFK